jgi:alanyl-tRNA synthetase
MSGVNEIRASFLDFFRREGHEVVPSSALVPRNDPTLMFANSGMVQFKNVFVGAERRAIPRATTAQKCVRAGGKHNDLDNVGYTARHHTFFEMLGNFSFGDYFKDHAIDMAWRLITKEWGIPEKRLLVTVYSDDDEAAQIWKKVAGLGDDRIIRIPTSDNFWRMGDTGPCGPCSEIFYDHGDHIPGGPPGSPDQDGDRFIEIWNLVFMQYEERAGGERVSLPRPSIDTGMGLERVAAVMQGTHDNYRIDTMQALIAAVADATGVEPDGQASHRVIADHLRCSSFLVADGVLPSNEGRGYVLRRIMRRAMRHAQLLGARDPLLHKLVRPLVREMGLAYPELQRAEALISETLRLEETRFRTTLARGMTLLEEATQTLPENGTLAGDVAFKLYDTYGFPLDLTQDALRPRGLSVDTTGFDQAMARQKAEARKAWSGSGEAATETVWFGVRERVGASEFLGYDTESAEGIITALIHEGVEVKTLLAGQSGFAVLNQTPFYAESGGQAGDAGVINAPGMRALVSETTKKLGDIFVHAVSVETGGLVLGQAVSLDVDHARRAAIKANHSATHLLHEALRLTLGDHVAQKGSLVAPERLRFDFAHPKTIEAAELLAVETLANAEIVANTSVSTRLMSVDDAIAAGARALFGEKYGDEVRVVSMGRDTGARPWSLELCGGTHVARTGDIGLVAVVSEGAVAAGVRRIEALTGSAARAHFAEQERRVREAAQMLKSSPADMLSRLQSVIEDRRRLERELADAMKKLAMSGGSGGAGSDIIEIAGVRLLARIVSGVKPNDLKSLADEAKASLGSGIVALVGVSEDGKGALVVAVTPDLVARFDAVQLVRAGVSALGGKGGGGRADMAQGGGPDGARGEEALSAVRAALSGV